MLVQVMTKAHKRFGVVYPAKETEYSILFNDDKSITLHKNRIAGVSFSVGDTAEHGSYNLRYLGEITKITDKAVTIVAYKGCKGMEQTYRLGLNEFCWRNWDFNLDKICKENHETSMCI